MDLIKRLHDMNSRVDEAAKNLVTNVLDNWNDARLSASDLTHLEEFRVILCTRINLIIQEKVSILKNYGYIKYGDHCRMIYNQLLKALRDPQVKMLWSIKHLDFVKDLVQTIKKDISTMKEYFV